MTTTTVANSDLEIPELPSLSRWSSKIVMPQRDIVGRINEKHQVLATLARPELCNVALVAEAGTGKSALVQGVARDDTRRDYREVNLPKMISELPATEHMPNAVQDLFEEASQYAELFDRELVLFIDEFHQLVQLSPAAVEAIKPVLAASGQRGIKIIVATTFAEFHEFIAPNQPLVERLERIDLPQTDRKTTIEILRGMAERYGVDHQFVGDGLFGLIHDYTNRHVPASSQPRKSIKVLDAMVGWYQYGGREMDMALLADVIYQTTGNNVALRVDASTIEKRLNERVLAQQFAVSQVTRRLHLCVAGLQDPMRPMGSFLFLGSTGTGKALADDTPVPVRTEDGSVAWKAHGELVAGDQVFAQDGSAEEVLGVFRQHDRDMYRITFWDGRTVDADGDHLWAVRTAKMRASHHAGRPVAPRLMRTREMVEAGVVRTYPGDGRAYLKYFVPAAQPVQWPERDLELDPYTLGVLIGDGCLTEACLTISSVDEPVVERVGRALGAEPKKLHEGNHGWVFVTGRHEASGQDRLVSTRAVLGELGLAGVKSVDRSIPAEYMTASVEQRWELVRGLFDTDGTVEATSGRFRVMYSTASQSLAQDVRRLLFSLGVSNTVSTYVREREGRTLVEHVVKPKLPAEQRPELFSLPAKRAVAERAAQEMSGRERVEEFDMVGISSIEKLPGKHSASCIYVGHEDHLYQAGDFVVTHNTELTKQMAKLLFGDDTRHLIRFDMAEFPGEGDVNRFRSELSREVSNRPFAVVLLDEIEKASLAVNRLLLAVLDDGRLSDDYGRQVSFLNTYIVMTTNVGADNFERMATYDQSTTGSDENLGDYMAQLNMALQQTSGGKFPPELLGRVDVIAPFQGLAPETREAITKNKLEHLRATLSRQFGIRAVFDERMVHYITEDNTSSSTKAGGARDVARTITAKITTEVAIFMNNHPNVKNIDIGIEGELASENKYRRVSDAKVVVTARHESK